MIHLHHVSLIVSNTQRAVDFYCGVLGLEQDSQRPELGFPGAWLNVGKQQIHLLELANPDPIAGRPVHGGRDRHTAFMVDDFEAIKARLEAIEIPYTLSQSGRRALFCRDPDQNGVELMARS